jgi:hypothetical protein
MSFSKRALLRDRNSRIDLICDLNFHKYYYVPIQDYEKFINEENLDVEKYNISKRKKFEDEYYSKVNELEGKYEEQIYEELEYEHFNINPLFYNDEIYFEQYNIIDLQNRVVKDLQKIYGNDYFNPYE